MADTRLQPDSVQEEHCQLVTAAHWEHLTSVPQSQTPTFPVSYPGDSGGDLWDTLVMGGVQLATGTGGPWGEDLEIP